MAQKITVSNHTAGGWVDQIRIGWRADATATSRRAAMQVFFMMLGMMLVVLVVLVVLVEQV